MVTFAISKAGRRARQACSVALLMSAVLTGCGGSSGSQSPASPVTSASQIAVEPMTNVSVLAKTGYLSDPFPVQPWLSQAVPSASQSFSGTTQAIVTCSGSVQPECFESTPVTVDFSSLQPQANAVGASIQTRENNAIFQDQSGTWQMTTVLVVHSIANPSAGSWDVIAHAHPSSSGSDIPTQWTCDSVLVGSFSQSYPGNYGAKYFEDGGKLYLVYVARVSTQPSENGVVAQLMESPTQLASSAPVVLLKPTDSDGGYNSEYAQIQHSTDTFKLTETGNITVVDGKYVMGYSVGYYDEPDYKAGLAFSDTFLPPSGSYYKKMLKLDTAGVWGQAGHPEVQYILQSQQSEWPNYVASQVLAPGVPSVEQDENGNWHLFFAGYAPSDAPPSPTKGAGHYDGTHRRPFYIDLEVNIPAGATVAGTSNYDLVNWIQPVTSQ